MAIGFTRWRRQGRSPFFPSPGLMPTAVLAAAFCLTTLPSCTQPQPVTHPKVQRYSNAPEAEKINVNLLRLEYRVRSEGTSLADTASTMGMSTVGNSIGLEIFVSPLDAKVVQKFQFPGVRVRHVSMQYRRVLLVVDDLSLLYVLARIPEVRAIAPEYGATTQLDARGQLSVSPLSPALSPSVDALTSESISDLRTSAISRPNHMQVGVLFDGR